jgi:hypothetical protein
VLCVACVCECASLCVVLHASALAWLCTHVSVSVYTHTHTHALTHTRTHAHTHTRTHAHTLTHMRRAGAKWGRVRGAGVREPLSGVKPKDLRYMDGDCDANISSS